MVGVRAATARRVAWGTGLASIALMVGALVILFVDRHAVLPSDAARWSFTSVFDWVTNLAVPTIGIVLVSRRPENPIGWLFLAAGFALALGSFGSFYGLHALKASPGSLPAGRLLAWFSNWIWVVANCLLVYLFLLFPTGRLRSRRWRPVAWFGGAVLLWLLGSAVAYSTAAWSFPFGPVPPSAGLARTAGAILTVGAIVALPAAVVASFVSVVMRFVGSVGEERLQLKRFVTAASLVALSFVSFFLSSSAGSVFTSLALLFLYTAIGVAVLKYRLYGIDVVISRAVVLGSLAAFITVVYVGLVVGIGTLVGNRRSAVLSALAAAVVAVAFQPVRQRAHRLANRLVYGERATPYEVLSDFAERIAGAYSSEDILPRMAQIVAAGTGAARTLVWLRVGNELRPEASSDGVLDGAVVAIAIAGDEPPSMPAGEVAVPVMHRDSLLGMISIRMPRGEALTPAGERLVTDVASQAGLVLSNVRLIEELRASRQRLVAAQDAERRRLERDLHDGAQQQLVALAVKQRLVSVMLAKDPSKAAGLLEALQTETTEALENLRDLARGIYPPLLADQGLAAALAAQARKAALPVEMEAEGIGRYPQEAEAAVYFCCLEALQNVAKYAGASRVRVHLSASDGELMFRVTDDGRGFDPARTPTGSGLQNMADRLAALGGTVEVRSQPGEGVTVSGRLPAMDLRAAT